MSTANVNTVLVFTAVAMIVALPGAWLVLENARRGPVPPAAVGAVFAGLAGAVCGSVFLAIELPELRTVAWISALTNIIAGVSVALARRASSRGR